MPHTRYSIHECRSVHTKKEKFEILQGLLDLLFVRDRVKIPLRHINEKQTWGNKTENI